MNYNCMLKLYKKQKDEVDELWNELDEFFEVMHKDEEKASHLMFSEMRAFYIKWREYTEAQIALDNITNVEFGVEDED